MLVNLIKTSSKLVTREKFSRELNRKSCKVFQEIVFIKNKKYIKFSRNTVAKRIYDTKSDSRDQLESRSKILNIPR